MIARLRPEIRYKDIFASFFSGRSYAGKFEEGLLDFFQVRKIILMQAARGGLYFLFRALPHKKVFIPSYTCWVVVEAAMLAGKEVELIDIRLDDYNLDVGLLRKKIKPKSIIVATHQFGIPCDMDEIMEIAADNDCYVIEDNAAGFGSEYKGKKTGTIAGAGVISFEFTKALSCGRGGAILFNDEKLFEAVNQQISRESKSSGFIYACNFLIHALLNKMLTGKLIYKAINFLFIRTKGLTTAAPRYLDAPYDLYLNRLNPNLAKLAYLNLKRIRAVIQGRREIANQYLALLKSINDFSLPEYDNDKAPVLMRFPVLLKGKDKESYYKQRLSKGLDMGFTFPYSCDPDRENSPNAHIAAESVLNLPVYSSLSKADVERIVKIARSEK